MSCNKIAKAKLNPNLLDASNPEPIANPSGKLWIARPIPTIIPVFKSELLLLILAFFLYIFFTKLSQNIIVATPNPIPKNKEPILDISRASGIKSKQITASISPAANCKTKLKKRAEVLLKVTPIIPPIVVPKVPKNSPKIAVWIISWMSKIKISL